MQRAKKPSCLACLGERDHAAFVVGWLGNQCDKTVMVAGPRESKAPGIGKAAEEFLTKAFGMLKAPVSS